MKKSPGFATLFSYCKELLLGQRRFQVKVSFNLKKIMLVLIPSIALFVIIMGIVTGSAKKGFDDSMRNSGLRMHYMMQVQRAFDESGDPYDVVGQGDKSGSAYMEIKFSNLDWDRTAKNDLYGILSKQGWLERNGGVFCKDDASLKVSAGASAFDDTGYAYVIMEYSSVSISECE